MSVQNGVAIPYNTSGLLWAGSDETTAARIALVESKFNSEVSIDAPTYGARFSPANSPFYTTINSASPNGAPMYTRNYWGHIATAATTTVKIVEANSVSGMFFSAAASTATFVIVSSSVNDAAAGTGIRTIGIVYIGRDGLRYQTTATMNGTTNVTVNLAVAATGLEYAYTTSVGSGGVAAGNITIKNTGSVTTMGQIATGNTNIVTTEQQVQTGKTIYLCGIRASAQTTAARIGVVYFSYDYTTGSATGAQQVDGERYRVAVGSVVYIPFNPPVSFKVPAGYTGRLWLTVTPDAVTASNYWASMDTFEATST